MEKRITFVGMDAHKVAIKRGDAAAGNCRARRVVGVPTRRRSVRRMVRKVSDARPVAARSGSATRPAPAATRCSAGFGSRERAAWWWRRPDSSQAGRSDQDGSSGRAQAGRAVPGGLLTEVHPPTARGRGGARPVPRPRGRSRGPGSQPSSAEQAPAAPRLGLDRRQESLGPGTPSLAAQPALRASRRPGRPRGLPAGDRACRAAATSARAAHRDAPANSLPTPKRSAPCVASAASTPSPPWDWWRSCTTSCASTRHAA